MNKEELYDLIERYLGGALPDAEHQEVERQMAIDADFRAEVELHRALHTSLGDAGNFRLRTALDNLLSDPPLTNDAPTSKTTPTLTGSFTWRQLTSIAALLAAIGFCLWLWLAPDDKTTRPISSQPVQNQPIDTASLPRQNTPPDSASLPSNWLWLASDGGTIRPIPSQPTQNQLIDTVPPDSASLPARPNPNKPIAMADPADFAPNPVLEAKIGDMVRGSGIGFELTSPATGTSFQLQNGQVTLPIRGTATGGDISADQPLELLIYPNRLEAWDNKQPIATFPMPLIRDDNDTYRVDFRPVFRTRPGLYYMVVGQRRTKEDGDGYRTLWVGKFMAQPGG